MNNIWHTFCLNLQWLTETEGKHRHINNKHFLRHHRPFVLFINPAKITNYTRAAHIVGVKKIGHYFVEGGDWDIEAKSIMLNRHYREIVDIYKHLRDYKKSSSYQESLGELRKGIIRTFHNITFDSVVEIDRYFERQVNLIKSIKNNGYLTRKKIIESKLYQNFEGQEKKIEKKLMREREIGAAIDRNGKLLFFRTGHHRLSAVTCLKIPQVPVEVFFVHEQWFKYHVCRRIGFSLGNLLNALHETEKEHQ